MKKILLFAAVLATISSCAPKTEQSNVNEPTIGEVAPVNGNLMPIAVVNVDTLLSNYKLAQESNDRLIKKQEDARLELNQKARNLQNEMIDFQKKLENNAFLSRERAEQEQSRLMRKEQELAAREQEISQTIMIEQQNITLQLRDSIDSAIKYLNRDGRYHMVVSTNSINDNVLYHAPGYDVTSTILEILNSRYKK